MLCFNAVIRITAPGDLPLKSCPPATYPRATSYSPTPPTPIVADSSVLRYNCINTGRVEARVARSRKYQRRYGVRGKLQTFRHSVHASMRNWRVRCSSLSVTSRCNMLNYFSRILLIIFFSLSLFYYSTSVSCCNLLSLRCFYHELPLYRYRY